jgi:hypothetical protein
MEAQCTSVPLPGQGGKEVEHEVVSAKGSPNSRWQRVPATRNQMGFYPIRAWAWVNIHTHGFANGKKLMPIGFAGTGVFLKYPYPQTHGFFYPAPELYLV